MKENAPFFVGYLKIPAKLHGFLIKVSVIIFASFVAGAFLAGASQDDPGKAGFRFDFGRQKLKGVLEANPYPLLHVISGSDRIDAGQTIMLTAQGKSGIMTDTNALNGRVVEATGVIVRRGDLDMLQVLPGQRGIKPTNEASILPASEPLGRWRLQGEICDGKCLAGAMQPGRGLAHKACANLCLLGDIPPVFVSSKPVEGEEFLMVGGADGGMLPRELYHFVGQFVEIEANVERRGDLLVVLVEAENVKVIK